MKILLNFILLCKLFTYVFTNSGSLPSFSLIEERSRNGNPLVKVTFTDGSSDFLVLNRYQGMDGHFIGHLKNEPDACVAMVNHPKHVELTIFSRRTAGLPMYKWKGNGEVELVPLPFTNGERDGDTVPIKNGAEDEVFDPVNEAEFLNIEENMTADQAASVPTTAKLQLKVYRPSQLSERYLGCDALSFSYNKEIHYLRLDMMTASWNI